MIALCNIQKLRVGQYRCSATYSSLHFKKNAIFLQDNKNSFGRSLWYTGGVNKVGGFKNWSFKNPL